MTAVTIIRKVFDAIPHNGVYERDLLHSMVGSLSRNNVELALAFLVQRNFIKKAGGSAHPMYVRMESAKTVYTNIAPLSPPEAEKLLKMHSNFEEKPR